MKILHYTFTSPSVQQPLFLFHHLLRPPKYVRANVRNNRALVTKN